MYSGFIEDNLANASYPIKLFKLLLDKYEPDWNKDYEISKAKDLYKIIDNFFSINYHNYDDDELLFIYKSVYSLAGFEESLKLVGEYLNFNININYDDQDSMTIRVDVENESFKNAALGFEYLNALINDLLFYKEMDVKFTKITIQVDALNISYDIMYFNSRIDKYFNTKSIYIGD